MVKVSDLVNAAKLTYITGTPADDRTVSDCYIGDLLSLAMAKVEQDSVWITIQTNINVVAVASLKDAACVVIADGYLPDENVIKKAEEEGVILLSQEASAYELARRFAGLGL